MLGMMVVMVMVVVVMVVKVVVVIVVGVVVVFKELELTVVTKTGVLVGCRGGAGHGGSVRKSVGDDGVVGSSCMVVVDVVVL